MWKLKSIVSDRIQRLCAQAGAGDPAACSELLGMHYPRIYAYFRRLCGDEAEAADLTQKTFVKVWGALAGFKQLSSFSTWVHGIAHHVYVDWRRRPDRLDRPGDAWWQSRAAEGASPLDDAEAKDLANYVHRAVERLEPDPRETVHLHYYQGLSLAETAETLGIGVSTVKNRLREALEEIRRRIADGKPAA